MIVHKNKKMLGTILKDPEYSIRLIICGSSKINMQYFIIRSSNFYITLYILFRKLLSKKKSLQGPLVNPDKILWLKIDSGLIFPE